jgi:hypothetical protein
MAKPAWIPERDRKGTIRLDCELPFDGSLTRSTIFETVGDGIGQLECRCGTCLLHMIATDGNGIELRHVLRRISKDISNDSHRMVRRIDVGVSNHELFENIILNGSRQLILFRSLLTKSNRLVDRDEESYLFFGCDDVHGQNWKNSSIHCH